MTTPWQKFFKSSRNCHSDPRTDWTLVLGDETLRSLCLKPIFLVITQEFSGYNRNLRTDRLMPDTDSRQLIGRKSACRRGAPEQQEQQTQQVLCERHCSRSLHTPAARMHTLLGETLSCINMKAQAHAGEVTEVRRDRKTLLESCVSAWAFNGFTAPLCGQRRRCTQEAATHGCRVLVQ